MKRLVAFAFLVIGGIGMASVAHAGWVVEWSNVVIQKSGQSLPADTSIMQIQGNKVRLAQPRSVTLIDYKKDTFTIMNPETQSFWSGTLEQYLDEVSKKRQAATERRLGRLRQRSAKTPGVDEAKLPQITIRKTDQTKTIAGHNVVKYEILSAGENFQEMWFAEDVDVSSDLDPDKFLAYQRTMSTSMQGQAGSRYKALYRNDDYRKLVSKGFALEVITRHIAGGFDRTVTAIRREDIPSSVFEIPEHYRRVALADVLPMPEQPASMTLPNAALTPGVKSAPKSGAAAR